MAILLLKMWEWSICLAFMCYIGIVRYNGHITHVEKKKINRKCFELFANRFNIFQNWQQTPWWTTEEGEEEDEVNNYLNFPKNCICVHFALHIWDDAVKQTFLSYFALNYVFLTTNVNLSMLFGRMRYSLQNQNKQNESTKKKWFKKWNSFFYELIIMWSVTFDWIE